LQLILRDGIGQESHRLVAGLYLDKSLRHGALAKDVERLCEEWGGSEPRRLTPIMAEATALGIPQYSLRDRTLELAGAIHFGSRTWTSSVLSHLSFAAREAKSILPICTVTWNAFDETMLAFRTSQLESNKLFPELPGLHELNKPNVLHGARASFSCADQGGMEKQNCKVFQSESRLRLRLSTTNETTRAVS
jgi:hypothetical protein